MESPFRLELTSPFQLEFCLNRNLTEMISDFFQESISTGILSELRSYGNDPRPSLGYLLDLGRFEPTF